MADDGASITRAISPRGGRSPYRRGAEFERLIIERLGLLGYSAWRVAGSRGDVDVLAIKLTKPAMVTMPAASCNETFESDPLWGRECVSQHSVLLIQCKAGSSGKMTPIKKATLILLAKSLGSIPVLAHQPPGRVALTRLDDSTEIA